MNTVRAAHINSLDNCVTLTDSANDGDAVCFLSGGKEISVTARGSIPKWHKMASNPIKQGGCVYKYGAVIGVALRDIAAGDHVHVHNTGSLPEFRK